MVSLRPYVVADEVGDFSYYPSEAAMLFGQQPQRLPRYNSVFRKSAGRAGFLFGSAEFSPGAFVVSGAETWVSE